MNYIATYESDPISHHGILGQKWGIRRYQNKDGTLTSAGKNRYGVNKASYSAEYRDGKLTNWGQDKVSKDAINMRTSSTGDSEKEFYDTYKDDLELEALRKKMADIHYAEEDETLDKSKGTAYEQCVNVGEEWISNKLGIYAEESITEFHVFEDAYIETKTKGIIANMINTLAVKDAYHRVLEEGTPNNHETKARKKMAGVDDENEAWTQLDMKIRDKSVDWYWSEPKSEGMKKLYADAEASGKKPSHNEILEQVLKDIGEPVTQDNIDAIRDIVFWD